VREFHLPLTLIFAGSALVGLLMVVILAVGGVNLGLNLAIVGLFLGLLVPLGIEIRNKGGRARRILVLDYRVHEFGNAVLRGVKRALDDDSRHWSVEYATDTDGDDPAQWQTHRLQTSWIRKFDGIVLVPARDDPRLWSALASLIKDQTFVVAVDTKPPNEVFRKVGVDAPRFVSSRYGETGILVAALLGEYLREDPTRRCIVWIGPDHSWPGEERSRNIVYTLARNELLEGRTMLLPIRDWAPEAPQLSTTLRWVREAPGQVAVYCADDENAMALHMLAMHEPGLRERMLIIGCNGTADERGKCRVIDTCAADATIDILAEQQGAAAADFLVRERTGELPAGERTRFIEPVVLRQSDDADRWRQIIEDARREEPSVPPPPPRPKLTAMKDDGGIVELKLEHGGAGGDGAGPATGAGADRPRDSEDGPSSPTSSMGTGNPG
jgi:DNA-binding LacI/PurR family transcriptional regulator